MNLRIKYHSYLKSIIIQNNLPKDTRNNLLQTLSNLATREYLSSIIIDNDGVKLFIKALRDNWNIEGQRIAARGLGYLTARKRNVRLSVISEISEEIKALYRNDIDSVVGSYIQAIIHPGGK